jgi:CheY-like chemotaxis protein
MSPEVTPRPSRKVPSDGPPELTLTPKTVLVVEDDSDTRATLRDLLEDHGYRVDTATNGEEALHSLQARGAPDCMVLDLWMPVMDGWQLAEALTDPKFPQIPIVVVTAGEVIWRYPRNAMHVMRKPIRPEPLLALVADALARRD